MKLGWGTLPISGRWSLVFSLLCDQRFQPRQALLEFRVLLLQRFDLLLLLRVHLFQLRLDLVLQRKSATGAGVLRGAQLAVRVHAYDMGIINRSEEHTSELQSLRHLVCRLL